MIWVTSCTVQVWVICASDTVRATGELHIVYE